MASLWVSCLLAGLVAGLISWYAGELTYEWFPAELRPAKTSMGQDVMDVTPETARVSVTKSALFSSALLGGTLGLCFGLAGGLSRGAVRMAMAAGLFGLVLAAAAGFSATYALLRVYFATRADSAESIGSSLVIHAAIWSAIAAFAGLALGLGLADKRRAPRALLGAAVGGALGAVIYEVAGCIAFPYAKTTQMISVTWETRLMARLLVSLLAAIGAAVFLVPPKERLPKKPVGEA
jgi:hypothetical protein